MGIAIFRVGREAFVQRKLGQRQFAIFAMLWACQRVKSGATGPPRSQSQPSRAVSHTASHDQPQPAVRPVAWPSNDRRITHAPCCPPNGAVSRSACSRSVRALETGTRAAVVQAGLRARGRQALAREFVFWLCPLQLLKMSFRRPSNTGVANGTGEVSSHVDGRSPCG